jgi:acyl carrier protein
MSQRSEAQVIKDAIAEVAPEVVEELETIDPDADVFELLGLDSMDHLNVMVELCEKTGVDVPEREYGRLRGLRALAEYVASSRETSPDR